MFRRSRGLNQRLYVTCMVVLYCYASASSMLAFMVALTVDLSGHVHVSVSRVPGCMHRSLRRTVLRCFCLVPGCWTFSSVLD